jgi:hypothetical protein
MPPGHRPQSSSKSAAAPRLALEPMAAISQSVAQLQLSKVNEASMVDPAEPKVEVDSPPVLVTVTKENTIDLTDTTSPSTPIELGSPNVPTKESVASSTDSERYVCSFILDRN